MSYPDPHNALPVYLEANKLLRGRNPQYGVEKLELAAGLGYAPALCMLGSLYYYGEFGLTRDYAHALRLFQAAADLGYDDAMNYLGIFYLKGYGVDPDRQKAIDWFRRSAREGNLHAKNNLLQMGEYW